MADEPKYKGIPLEQLQIDAISWSEDAATHIRTRSSRGNPNERDIEPEWATEAALDPGRIVAVAGANTPETASIKVIGQSEAAGGLVKVWIWTDDPSGDAWNGGSACMASDKDNRRYKEANSDE